MVLGITGLSGAGKHTAADFLAQRDWLILDVDKIAHHLYRPYTHVWKAIMKHFGEKLLNQDDTINRQKLGALVFDEKDPKKACPEQGRGADQELKTLNAIVHPAIKLYLKDYLHRHFRRKTNIAIVAALWKELGLRGLCDKALLIKADPMVAQKRIQARDSISVEVYKRRIKNQSVPKDPDWILENNGTHQEFYQKLAKIKL